MAEARISKFFSSFKYEFRLIKFCRRKLEMLIGYGVKPILIFDGAKLQMKQ
jgi:hypothetical protein